VRSALFTLLCVAALGTVSPALLAADSGFEVVDQPDRFPSKVFARGYVPVSWHWMDNERVIATIERMADFDFQKADLKKKIFIFNTRTGSAEEIPHYGQVRCFDDGRVIISQPRWDPVARKAPGFALHGRLGGKMQEYEKLPKDQLINQFSCRLENRLELRPAPAGFDSSYLALREGHGVLRWTMRRAPGFPWQEYYLDRADGQRVDIPLNPGEKVSSSHVHYVPFENSYLLVPDLVDTNPVPIWEPRFVRLLSPGGEIKRIPVPEPLFEWVKTGRAYVSATYTKRGVIWFVGDARTLRLPSVAGNYIMEGNKLVRFERAGILSPDGCRLVGATRRKDGLSDLYVTDICWGR
jgi:hypothetical protein